MREIGFVIAVVILLAAVQVISLVLATPTLLNFGLALIASGLLVSIPAAIIYHLRLLQVLHPRGLLHRGWIWQPMKLHVHLRGAERVSVLAWFGLGVLGWSATLAGCGLVGLSLLAIS